MLGLLKRPFGGKQLLIILQQPNYGLDRLRALTSRDALKPLIDGPYPFIELRDQLVHYLRADHRGKVVLTVV